jgi:DNA end-binding protein Ku
VEELIARKREGEIVVTDTGTKQAAPVVDLMDALQASVKAARSHKPGNAEVAPLVSAGRASAAKATKTAKATKAVRAAKPSGEDLSVLSKVELSKRAAALGIEGRSKMTREELESAVAGATAASTTSRRRKAS